LGDGGKSGVVVLCNGLVCILGIDKKAVESAALIMRHHRKGLCLSAMFVCRLFLMFLSLSLFLEHIGASEQVNTVLGGYERAIY
jgi:hypothetical protein